MNGTTDGAGELLGDVESKGAAQNSGGRRDGKEGGCGGKEWDKISLTTSFPSDEGNWELRRGK